MYALEITDQRRNRLKHSLLYVTDASVLIRRDGLAIAVDNFLSDIRCTAKAGYDVCEVRLCNV